MKLLFSKIVDMVNSEGPISVLYAHEKDYWVKLKLTGHGDFIFFRVTFNDLLDFVTNITNLYGLVNNSPGSELFVSRGSCLSSISKVSFDHTEIQSGKKMFKDFPPDCTKEFLNWIES